MSGMTRQTAEKMDGQESSHATSAASSTLRIKSEDLFQQQREVEIDHQGRIYRLRLTQMNKLILTA